MIKVFDYDYSQLNKLKKRNNVLGILFFVIGFALALTFLLTHNRENSTLMCIFCILSIFIFSTLGLTFLLILNSPVSKIMALVKNSKNAMTNVYEIKEIKNEVFSQNGLSFKKVVVCDANNVEQIFYLEKSFSLSDSKSIKITNVNSVIIAYEVLQ